MSLLVFFMDFPSCCVTHYWNIAAANGASRDSITYTMSVLGASLGVASVTWLFQSISVPQEYGKTVWQQETVHCRVKIWQLFYLLQILIFSFGGEGSVWVLQGSYCEVKGAALGLKMRFVSSLRRREVKLQSDKAPGILLVSLSSGKVNYNTKRICSWNVKVVLAAVEEGGILPRMPEGCRGLC